MSSQRIKHLEMALRDAISTYKGSDKLVSAERIEAWEHALADDKAIGNEYPDLELPSELERMREQLFRMRAQLFDVSDELSEAKKDTALLSELADCYFLRRCEGLLELMMRADRRTDRRTQPQK